MNFIPEKTVLALLINLYLEEAESRLGLGFKVICTSLTDKGKLQLQESPKLKIEEIDKDLFYCLVSVIAIGDYSKEVYDLAVEFNLLDDFKEWYKKYLEEFSCNS